MEAVATSDPREEMRLHTAVGASLPGAPEMEAAFTKALDIAKTLDDSEYQLRALRGLYFYNTRNTHYRAALPFAERFHELTISRPNLSDRLGRELINGLSRTRAKMSVHGPKAAFVRVPKSQKCQ